MVGSVKNSLSLYTQIRSVQDCQGSVQVGWLLCRGCTFTTAPRSASRASEFSRTRCSHIHVDTLGAPLQEALDGQKAWHPQGSNCCTTEANSRHKLTCRVPQLLSVRKRLRGHFG